MRRHHWVEYMEEYEFELQYDPKKTNEIADALGRKNGMVTPVIVDDWNLSTTIEGYDL